MGRLSPPRQWIIVVLLASTFAVLFYGKIPWKLDQYAHWDLFQYAAMAEAAPGLAATVEQPFSFRLLAPYLVGLLPISVPDGFYVLTLISALVLSLLFFSFLSWRILSYSTATLVTILFVLNKYIFGLAVWDYFQLNDTLTLIFCVVLFWAMYKRRWVVFGIILLLGSVTRLATLLMVPVAMIYLVEQQQRDQLLQMLASSAPGILVFFIVRLLVPYSGGNSLLAAFTLYVPRYLQPEIWFRIFINPLAPFVLIPFIFWRTTREWFADKKYLIAFLSFIVFCTVFGENNERLMAPAALVFYPLLAVIIQKHLRHWGAVTALLLGAVIAFPHHQIGLFLLPNRSLTILLSGISLFLITAVCLYYRFRTHLVVAQTH